jgi:citrate lyase subunit alpha/citrate CoA-transferase
MESTSLMLNAIGRELPEYVSGYGQVTPFAGAWAIGPGVSRYAAPVKAVRPDERKVVDSLEEVFKRIPIRDGMTLSFHHHLRNGDGVANAVLATAARLGLKRLTVAMSAIFPVHAPLVDHIRSGVVAALDTDYLSGPVATAVSHGLLDQPVILRTHGGRARAIEGGQLHVDVAFIGAPTADDYGNINGVAGPTACGSLGYAFPDAEYADWVVAVTDNLVEYPLAPISIPQTRVDYVVCLPRIGDPAGIVSGTTRVTQDQSRLEIARMAARVIEAAGFIRDGFSYQTGAGGTSLAVTQFVRQAMEETGVIGSFALGGITGPLVDMLERGLFRTLMDVQGFDLQAVRSIATNSNHLEVGASMYANPFTSGCAVNRLDCVILGATEVDTNFNVNVITGSDGIIRGGSGGHSDTAAGAKLRVVVAVARRGDVPIVTDRVVTATTPGESIDVVVTDCGIAVNPARTDLAQLLKSRGLAVKDIAYLKASADGGVCRSRPVPDGKIVAVVEYRDGTVIDVVRQAAA